MRKLLFFFLLTTLLNAQEFNNTITINSDTLKEKSISLIDLWRYSPGDSLKWAQPEFDDSSWDTLNPRLKWGQYDTAKWKGIGWFRKFLIIDSTLFNKSVSFTINHVGASEIFLNGEKIHSFGRVDTNPDSERIYIPHDIPIALNFTSDTSYVLAVRYSNHQSLIEPEWMDSWYGDHGFVSRLHEINSRIKTLINNGMTNFGVNFAIGGIFLSLSILYFLLHLFYRKRKENLYYSLFSFSLAILFFSSMLGNLVFQNLTWVIVYRAVGMTGVSVAFLGYLGFVYSIFYEKIPKQIWLFVLGALILAFLIIYLPLREWAGYFLPVYIFLAAMEGLRVIIVAIKKDKDHSWVIGSGVLVFVSLILLIFIINLFELNPPQLLILVLFLIGLFGLPSSMSVYLARSIASTNKKLEEQVEEIKDLSAQQLEIQKKNADLKLDAEKEKAARNEAVLQAKAAELQAKASEAERRVLEVENERKTRELEEARRLQLSMLPKTLPNVPHLDISVHMETATEVGGDYYDFYEDQNGELTLLIGDATGHGLNAGTMVTATKSLFNSLGSNPDIVDTFHKMSGSLKQMNFRLLSMCLMLLKINGNKIRLSSAGMPPALIYRKESSEIEEFVIKGMPLGAAGNFPYELRETEINDGDTILLMSDGFPELFNEEKKMFGYKNVHEEFLKCADDSTENIIKYLLGKIKSWTGNKAIDDDITFVVVKVK
jgi:serine phosphatase RsbU (regulator of sigma subunit)